eukprot:m.101771 g.101771  ORF g.101771 m.101771 type:complete len:468 (-) comp13756_c0_seq1:23-1426(-)
MVSTVLLVFALIPVTFTLTPPAKCAGVMNAFCNTAPSMQECITKVKEKGGTLPLVALYDSGNNEKSGEAWRCYSPKCLTNNNTKYKNGTDCILYCSEEELADILENCTDPVPPATGREINVSATDIYGKLAETCGQIRTPEILNTGTRLVLFGQCRKANTYNNSLIGDDMRDVRMLSVYSSDNGKTWSNATFITPIATSVGVGIYDRIRKTIVFQYQSFTSSNPYTGNKLLQMISKDDGETWSAPEDITHFIAACNTPDQQVCGAAGTRLQTSSGRLVFSGHSGATPGLCVWYSDDGGATYTVSNTGLFTGNENSIADIGNGTLYMNGRGLSFPWAGHRTSYWSYDDGTTWSNGSEARNLVEPNSFGCDGAVIAVPNQNTTLDSAPPRIFFSEPHGPGSRISLRVWCSLDAGKTWPRYTQFNTGQSAAYSALDYVMENGEPVLIVVWESEHTQLSYRLTVNDWCPIN